MHRGITFWRVRPARSMAALMAAAPRLGAAISLRLPPKVPIAVRAGFAKTTERGDVMLIAPLPKNAEMRGRGLATTLRRAGTSRLSISNGASASSTASTMAGGPDRAAFADQRFEFVRPTT